MSEEEPPANSHGNGKIYLISLVNRQCADKIVLNDIKI